MCVAYSIRVCLMRTCVMVNQWEHLGTVVSYEESVSGITCYIRVGGDMRFTHMFVNVNNKYYYGLNTLKYLGSLN